METAPKRDFHKIAECLRGRKEIGDWKGNQRGKKRILKSRDVSPGVMVKTFGLQSVKSLISNPGYSTNTKIVKFGASYLILLGIFFPLHLNYRKIRRSIL